MEKLVDRGSIDVTDYYFALSVSRVFPQASPLTLILAALTSQALSRGMIFLDIAGFTETPFQEEISPVLSSDSGFCLPESDRWIQELQTCSGGSILIQTSDSINEPPPSHSPHCPLILDEKGCLYLAKYFYFRIRLAENIHSRLEAAPLDISRSHLIETIEKIFQGQDPNACAPQKLAVEQALLHRFSLISGGPGTGKTHITRLITNLILSQAQEKGLPEPVILSLAPTGKAASRLENGVTIHSALIPLADGPEFVHNRNNPLSADLVIIDEGSMIDLALMTRLFEAISVETRIVLLGDANQLPPVQAGAVFSELCNAKNMTAFRTVLTHNFRSQGKTGIGQLACAFQKKNHGEVRKILGHSQYPDLVFHDTRKLSPANIRALVDRYMKEGYAEFFRQKDMEKTLEKMDQFRILCAHNKGDLGTWAVNARCENLLHNSLDSDIKHKFSKQLIMITVNNYQKGLCNGDTGVVIGEKDPHACGGDAGFFHSDQKGIRKFRYTDLPAHESAFAVTVHKSQGSEFDQVLILIPETISPVIHGQLLYTALTRARQKAIIIGNSEVIQTAMEKNPQQTCRLEHLI